MRLFVSEYLCSGAWKEEDLDNSLAREGKAMLLAAIADFQRIPGIELATTWDKRLGPFPSHIAKAIIITSPPEEQQLFSQLATDNDATFVIAPEFNGILANRCQAVIEAGRKFLGSSLSAIELCSDKLVTARHLTEYGVPTIETQPFDPSTRALSFPMPVVLKPIDGAGSQNTFLINKHEELEAACLDLANSSTSSQSMIQQPYIPGIPISVGLIISQETEQLEFFPPGTQLLCDNGRFEYSGGEIPIHSTPTHQEAIYEIAEKTCECIDGLNGYVGIDMVLSEQSTRQPVVVEINPRLTTSYIGYRSLTKENIAERILFSQKRHSPIGWNINRCQFSPDGTVTIDQSQLQ